MSARKWPLSTLPVGESFVAEKPPRNFISYVHHHGLRFGKKFKTKRVDNGREVRRIA